MCTVCARRLLQYFVEAKERNPRGSPSTGPGGPFTVPLATTGKADMLLWPGLHLLASGGKNGHRAGNMLPDVLRTTKRAEVSVGTQAAGGRWSLVEWRRTAHCSLSCGCNCQGTLVLILNFTWTESPYRLCNTYMPSLEINDGQTPTSFHPVEKQCPWCHGPCLVTRPLVPKVTTMLGVYLLCSFFSLGFHYYI